MANSLRKGAYGLLPMSSLGGLEFELKHQAELLTGVWIFPLIDPTLAQRDRVDFYTFSSHQKSSIAAICPSGCAFSAIPHFRYRQLQRPNCVARPRDREFSAAHW